MWNAPCRLLGFAVLISALATAAASAQVQCDVFAIHVSLEGHTVTVNLETDLPDAAVVMVSIDRTYWKAGVKDAYSESYLSVRSTVGEWRQPRKVDVDDAIWQAALEKRQQLLSRMGEPFKVERIAKEIEVSFVVPINQPDPRFGKGNDKLSGSQVATSDLRVIRREQVLQLPLGAPRVSQQPKQPVSADSLEVDKSYRLSDRTPLMPRREGKDVRDIVNVRHLDRGLIIEIAERDETELSPWYRVEATDSDGEFAGRGWINSKALVRQEIVEVENPPKKPRDTYKIVGGVEDVSYANVKRLSIRVQVPLHRTEDEVNATLKKAVLDLYEKERRRPKAINVFAYMPGDDYEMAYTVGVAIYAPNGKWEDADRSAPMGLSIELGTVYSEVSRFANDYAPGVTVPLQSPGGTPIRIARSTDDWSERNIVAVVEADTPAEIVEQRVRAFTSTAVQVWFRVKVRVDNGDVTGWVKSENVDG